MDSSFGTLRTGSFDTLEAGPSITFGAGPSTAQGRQAHPSSHDSEACAALLLSFRIAPAARELEERLE
jgi:hypothetical protein